jgi:hypothetical protein
VCRSVDGVDELARLMKQTLETWNSFAIGADRGDRLFRGFLPRKTTPRYLCQATVIARLLKRDGADLV